MSFRDLDLTHTCTVTKPGNVPVVSDLACTPPEPANGRYWNLATTFKMYELHTAYETAVMENMQVAINGRFFTLKQLQKWEPDGTDPGELVLLIEEKT